MSIKSTVKRNRNIFSTVAAVLLFLYSLTLILALLWAFMSSLQPRTAFRYYAFSWPEHPFKNGVANYISAFWEMYSPAKPYFFQTDIAMREVYLPELFFNTFAYSIGCTIFATLSPCIVAYAVAKYKFPGRNLLYSIVIVTMILPIIGSLPSEMEVVKTLGFYNNVVLIWLMKGTFLGMYFLIFYAAFKSLSWEYAEAAFIDGASHFRVMTRIMLPLVFPTILAVALLIFIGFFNDYMTQLLYLPSMPSVSYALWQLMLGGGNSSNAGSYAPVQMAACILVSIPMFILFMLAKNQLIGNLSVGGIKG